MKAGTLKTLLIAAAAILLSLPALATEPVVALAPPFRVGDVAIVTVSKSRVVVQDGKTQRSPVGRMDATLKVLEAGPEGFVITWTLAMPAVDGATPEAQARLKDLLADMGDIPDMEILLSETSDVMGLRNWEAVRDASLGMARALMRELRPEVTDEEFEKVMKVTHDLFANRAFAEPALLKDVSPFLAHYGYQVDAAEPLKYEQELPNPLGGEPLPATVTLAVVEFDDGAPTTRLRLTQELQPEALNQLTQAFMQKMLHLAPAGTEPPKDFTASVRDQVDFTFEKERGWITDMKLERVLTAGPMTRTERTEWTLKRLDQGPEVPEP